MSNQLGDKFNRARDYASEKTAIVRENAAVAYDASREAVDAAKERGTKMVQDNPLAVVAGGLVIGALLGALLPKAAKGRGRAAAALTASLLAAKSAKATASDELAKAGGKIKEKIGDIDTEAAKAKLTELANVDRAKEKLSGIIEKASEAVSLAGKTAAETLRRKD